MSKRIKVFVGAVVAAVAVLATVLCLLPGGNLLTDKVKNVTSVSVTYDPFGSAQQQQVEDEATQQEILRLLTQTRIKANRYPPHSQAQTSDPKYTITIVYQSGETDEIRSAENPAYIYRFLFTHGSDGDKGYVYGVNEELSAYIASLKE